jgi:putative transposase
MSSHIVLTDSDRKTLLDYYRGQTDPDLRLRAHVLLLLADGHSWSLIVTMLYCSSRTIARWKDRFEKGGLPALFGKPRGAPPRYGRYWVDLVVSWFRTSSPRVFGFLRSRWSCALVVVLLFQEHRLHVSQETVRRWLHQADLVWRRPRPVLKRCDPNYASIIADLRTLLHELPPDETVVFMDEADVNLNPDIGFMWMPRAEQTEIPTPGDNQKNYLAGSLHWRTGTLLAPLTGPRRNGDLVARHLEELCHCLRRYRRIHVIWDNAKIHDCAVVNKVLARHASRLQVHFLPKYAPQCNPVERVWWHLRNEITRNHQCQTLDELINLVFAWLDGSHFVVEDSVYREHHKTKTKSNAA